MEKIILDFKGPFRWHGSPEEVVFSQEVANYPGIYLWCVEQPSGYLVYYVGETAAAFKDRFKSHTRSFFQGEYGIWSANEFVQGTRVEVWPGKWRTANKEGWSYEFIQRSPELIPKLVEFLGAIRIFLAPLKTERLIRQRIESALAAELKRKPGPIGSFIDADLRHGGRIINGERLLVEINTPAPFQGIPAELEVTISRSA